MKTAKNLVVFWAILIALILAAVPASAQLTATDLGALGGDWSEANAINNGGQVAGASETATGETHAYLWEKGAMTDLGTLGGGWSYAYAINDHGQVVGASLAGDGYAHAFLWENGMMQDLGTLSGMGATQNGMLTRILTAGHIPGIAHLSITDSQGNALPGGVSGDWKITPTVKPAPDPSGTAGSVSTDQKPGSSPSRAATRSEDSSTASRVSKAGSCSTPKENPYRSKTERTRVVALTLPRSRARLYNGLVKATRVGGSSTTTTSEP